MSPNPYQDNPWSFADSSEMHPRAAEYQSILDNNQKLGLIGASLMIRDEYGLWLGGSGMSDVEAGQEVETAQRFHIASITKVFTAATVFSLVDKDELGTADGGISINAYDTGLFFEKLMKGYLLSEESLAQMTDWFELPPLWGYESIGLSENGYGIEKFTKQPEYAVGHTGSVMGFSTMAQYFPESDFTYVLLVNSASYEDEEIRLRIYDECMEVIF